MILQLDSLLYSHILNHGTLDERVCMYHAVTAIADVQYVVQVLVVLWEMGERQNMMRVQPRVRLSAKFTRPSRSPSQWINDIMKPFTHSILVPIIPRLSRPHSACRDIDMQSLE